jgi:hypothetical protein
LAGVMVLQKPILKIQFSPKGDGIYLKYGYPFNGVLAQLVERLNGIEKATGSNPVNSTKFNMSLIYKKRLCKLLTKILSCDSYESVRVSEIILKLVKNGNKKI